MCPGKIGPLVLERRENSVSTSSGAEWLFCASEWLGSHAGHQTSRYQLLIRVTSATGAPSLTRRHASGFDSHLPVETQDSKKPRTFPWRVESRKTCLPFTDQSETVPGTRRLELSTACYVSSPHSCPPSIKASIFGSRHRGPSWASYDEALHR